MSISFWTDREPETTTQESCCLCAQMAPCWHGTALPRGDAALNELRSHADPKCPYCLGSGVERLTVPEDPYPNFCNDNAALVLRALGLPEEYGESPISDFRRACIRALAKGRYETREPIEERFPARVANGSIHRGGWVFAQGLDAEGIQSRIEGLIEFVTREAAKGAMIVRWG